MRVREIWRYPVKSMAGEQVDVTTVDQRGIHGDRLWALRDEDKQILTTARRIPALLACSARYVREPTPDVAPGNIPDVVVTLPDGSTVRSDDPDANARISAALGRRVSLCALRPATDRAHYRSGKSTADQMRHDFALAADEPLPDFSMLPMEKLLELGKYVTPPGTYFDVMQLHILTTASLAALHEMRPESVFDARRFRPNLVIETSEPGLVELGWTGGTLHAGTAAAFIDCPTPRCSVPTRAQAELPADPKVLKTLADHADRCAGVYATVTTPGAVRVGDDARFDPPETSKLGEWARTRATSIKRMLLRAALPK